MTEKFIIQRIAEQVEYINKRILFDIYYKDPLYKRQVEIIESAIDQKEYFEELLKNENRTS